jgi:hypothetical protein
VLAAQAAGSVGAGTTTAHDASAADTAAAAVGSRLAIVGPNLRWKPGKSSDWRNAMSRGP